MQRLSEERDLTDRLGALKIESERQLTHDAREALRLAEVLVDEATLADRADYRALGLMAKGDALRNLGRHREALAHLEIAGDQFLTLGDEVGWARTRLGWVWSVHQLSRGAIALEAAGAAHAIFVGHAEWLLAAGLDLNTAFVCFELGRNAEALRLLDRALTLYERAGQADASLRVDVAIRSAKARANKARILTLLGSFDEGIRLFEAARDIFELHGRDRFGGAGRAVHRLGLYATRGTIRGPCACTRRCTARSCGQASRTSPSRCCCAWLSATWA